MDVLASAIKSECPRQLRITRYAALRTSVLAWLPPVHREGWTFSQLQIQLNVDQPALCLTLGALRKAGLARRHMEYDIGFGRRIPRWYRM